MTAAAAARRWDLGDDAVCVPVSSRVTRVTRGGVDVALKLFAAGDARAARAEHALLERLAAHPDPRVRVQRLVPARGVETLVELDDASLAFATEWAPGHKRSYDALDGETWAALGAALAALHDALGDDNALGLPDVVADAAARDLAAERARIVADGAAVVAAGGARYAPIFDARLRLIDESGPGSFGAPPADTARAGPLHNDYNVHNFLFDAGHAAPLVLDFDRAACGPRELEVVRCLNHLPLVAPSFARRFVAAYVAVRPLRRALLPWAVDVALVAHAVKHWPAERFLAGAPGAVEMLDGIAAMTEALAGGRAALRAFFVAEGST